MRTLSYESVLERGFAVVFDAEGKPVKQAASVSAGDALSIRFRDGDVAVVAGEGTGVNPQSLYKQKGSVSRLRQSGIVILATVSRGIFRFLLRLLGLKAGLSLAVFFSRICHC